MKITFPPDDPSECGTWRNSRVYEALPQIMPVGTFLIMTWCIIVQISLFTTSKDLDMTSFEGMLILKNKMYSLGAMSRFPWGDDSWRLVTSTFVHSPSSLMHLLFNMMMLFTFGSLLERGIGTAKFLLFVVVTAYASSSLQLSIEGRGIGMSGVIYAIAGFMWAAWPRWTGFLEKFRGHTVKFFIFWQLICFIVSYAETVINFFANLFFQRSFDIGSYPFGNVAHISGMIFGYLIGTWACKGNQFGKQWLLASVAFLGLSVLVWFWSPWSNIWNDYDQNRAQLELEYKAYDDSE